MAVLRTFTALTLASSALAHIAPFAAFTFGANGNGDANLAEPLTEGTGGIDKWFFRGLGPDSANEVATLQPGGTLDLKLACSKHNAEDGSDQPCNNPSDGALHRKSDGGGSGCSLSISYKDFNSIQPNDMQVFSVLYDCVKPSKTHTFAIPSNLPSGDATCAFHWVPPSSSSADEQYHTGFRCKVAGNNGGSISNGQPPLYFAAQGIQRPNGRPQYNSDRPNGAQQLQISGSGIAASANVQAGTNNANTNAGSGSSNGEAKSESNGQASSGSGSSSAANGSGSSGKSSSGRCKSGRRKRSVHRRHHDVGLVDALSA